MPPGDAVVANNLTQTLAKSEKIAKLSLITKRHDSKELSTTATKRNVAVLGVSLDSAGGLALWGSWSFIPAHLLNVLQEYILQEFTARIWLMFVKKGSFFAGVFAVGFGLQANGGHLRSEKPSYPHLVHTLRALIL